jgi:hypothetical protein
MTEPGPFAPPGGHAPPPASTPPVPPPPVPPPPVAPTLPPPTGAPISVVPADAGSASAGPAGVVPIAAAPRRRRRWLLPVILGGSLLLAGLIAGVAIVAVQLATWASELPTALPPGGSDPDELRPPDDLVEGEPGDPVASEPLDCVTCFASDDVRDIDVPHRAYVTLGLPVDDRQPFEVPMFTDQRDAVGWWEEDGGSPDECYFAYTQPPLLFVPERDGIANSDLILYASSHSDPESAYWLTEASRIFTTHSAASAHMLELETAVDGCPAYSLTGAGYAAEVTPAPAFDVPADVAAYGWVETAGLSRFYAADVQRGNVVTRLSLLSDSQGPSEQQFRAFVEEYARALGALER